MAGKRGNNQGSIYKRRDGKLVAAVTLPDGRRKTCTTFATRAEAQRWVTDTLHDAARGRIAPAHQETVGAFCRRWLDDQMKPRIAANTYDNYETHLGRLMPFIGRVKLGDLKPAHILRAYATLRNAGVSESSIAASHGRLHQALTQAENWELIPRDPSRGIHPPRPQRREKRAMTREQVQTLLASSQGSRFHALWAVLVGTGLRISEALGLLWDDIDIEGRVIILTHQLSYQAGIYSRSRLKTRSSRRTIDLSPELCSVLASHRTAQKIERMRARDYHDIGLVFCRPNGEPLMRTNIVRTLHEALDDADLPSITPHELRHTYASLHRQLGTPAEVVQGQLGHASILMTSDIYTHVMPGQSADAARRMGEMFREKEAE